MRSWARSIWRPSASRASSPRQRAALPITRRQCSQGERGDEPARSGVQPEASGQSPIVAPEVEAVIDRLLGINEVSHSTGTVPTFLGLVGIETAVIRTAREALAAGSAFERDRAADQWQEQYREPALDGFRRVRIHDLKHTFGRRLRAMGVSFEDRQDLLGHKSGRITTHYSRAELSNLIAAAEKVWESDSHKTPASTWCGRSQLRSADDVQGCAHRDTPEPVITRPLVQHQGSGHRWIERVAPLFGYSPKASSLPGDFVRGVIGGVLVFERLDHDVFASCSAARACEVVVCLACARSEASAAGAIGLPIR